LGIVGAVCAHEAKQVLVVERYLDELVLRGPIEPPLP